MSEELYETKQFKLASGDEIICEVVQWNMDEETEIVVRKAMKLVMGETEGGNYRYYSFRPWMVYQEKSTGLYYIKRGTHSWYCSTC